VKDKRSKVQGPGICIAWGPHTCKTDTLQDNKVISHSPSSLSLCLLFIDPFTVNHCISVVYMQTSQISIIYLNAYYLSMPSTFNTLQAPIKQFTRPFTELFSVRPNVFHYTLHLSYKSDKSIAWKDSCLKRPIMWRVKH